MIRLALGVILSAVACVTVTAQETPKPTDEKVETLIAKVTDEEVEALIARLKSENPPPKTVNDPKRDVYIEWPEGFDRVKQQKVHDAFEKLTQLGVRAFPHLIEHGEDKAYSMTREYGTGFCYNDSVGKACRTVLLDQLSPFGRYPKVGGDPRGKLRRPDYASTFLDSQEDARKWWQARKTRSLAEIQLEVIDWVIVEEAKRPDDFHADEHALMKKVRKQLVETGKPLPPSSSTGGFILNRQAPR